MQRLAADLGGDAGIVERFVLDYLSLLDQRLDRLAELLDRGDDEAVRVWILSLETTSAMIGADGVVASAVGLRTLVESQSAPDEAVTQAYVGLQQAVAAFRTSLAGLGFTASLPTLRAAGE